MLYLNSFIKEKRKILIVMSYVFAHKKNNLIASFFFKHHIFN